MCILSYIHAFKPSYHNSVVAIRCDPKTFTNLKAANWSVVITKRIPFFIVHDSMAKDGGQLSPLEAASRK